MDSSRSLKKYYFASESDALQVDESISAIEIESFVDEITCRWFKPIEVDSGGVWFVMIDEANSDHLRIANKLSIDLQ